MMLVNPHRYPPPIGLGMATGGFLHQLGADTTTRGIVLDLIYGAGFRWVREEFAWPTIQPTDSVSFDWTISDAIVSEVAAKGLGLVIMTGGSPAWARPTTYAAGDGSSPPDSPSTFGTFCGIIAARYTGVRTWEIWNEPNLKTFWGGAGAPFNPDAAVYFDLLAAAYDAIKAVNSANIVVTAGLAQTATSGGNIAPVEYLDLVLDEGTNKMDGIGAHPYSYPLLPSSTFYDHGWRLMYGASTSMYTTMQAHGVGHLKFYITEFGAPTDAVRLIGARPGTITEAGAGSTTIAATKPTLLASVDVVLVAHFTANAAPTSVPSGWTIIPSSAVSNGTWASAGYYKAVLAANVAAEPATYSWGFASSSATVMIRPYYHVNMTTPIDAGATIASNNNATTVAVGAVTAVRPTCVLITGAGQNSNTGTITVPSGMSSPMGQSAGTGKSANFAELSLTANGSTGAKTWTFNSSALGHGGWMATLRPAASTAATVANNYSLDTYDAIGLAVYNDEATQANLYNEAIRAARSNPGIFAHFEGYTLNDQEAPNADPTVTVNRELHFGIVENSAAEKDAYDVIAAAITDTGGPT